MARWRLTAPHYLNGHRPGEEPDTWEYKETNRDTGRQAKKTFITPMHLNPDEQGEIIVCYEGKGQRSDVIFVGPPTPDMEPLDDEAHAISDKERPKWIHPIESLPGQGYSASLISDFERQMTELMRNVATKPAAPISTNGVDPAEFAALKEHVAQLMAQNAELQAQLPFEEPLPEPEPEPAARRA